MLIDSLLSLKEYNDTETLQFRKAQYTVRNIKYGLGNMGDAMVHSHEKNEHKSLEEEDIDVWKVLDTQYSC